MTLQNQILAPGATATASGQLIARAGRVGLSLDRRRFGMPLTGSVDRAPSIELVGSPTTQNWDWWESRHGSHLAVSGAWTGRALQIDQLPELVTDAAASQAPVRPASAVPESAPVPVAVSALTRQLISDETIVAMSTAKAHDGHTEAWVTAIDEAEAFSAFVPYFGERLHVVESRWTAELLDQLRQTLRNIPDGIRCSFGQYITPEHQVVLTATVSHLRQEDFEALSRFPPETFDLTVLLIPAGDEEAWT